MKTIPMRGVEWEELDQDYWDEQDNHDIQLLGESEPFFWGNPDDSLRKVWLLLLARAAGDASVSDGALHRMIKDATDNVEFDANSFDSCLREELDNENLVLSLKDGAERMTRLAKDKEAWSKLPSTKKHHKARRLIDRRFDGPKHKRTRDYDDFGDWAFGIDDLLGPF